MHDHDDPPSPGRAILQALIDEDYYEQTLQVYREYVQRIRDEEAQRVRQEAAARTQHLLVRLLTHRFGALPESLLARIHQQADTAMLTHWADRSFTAQSLDDVFA